MKNLIRMGRWELEGEKYRDKRKHERYIECRSWRLLHSRHNRDLGVEGVSVVVAVVPR